MGNNILDSDPICQDNRFTLINLGEIMQAISASGFVNHGNNLMLFRAVSYVFQNFPRDASIDAHVPRQALKPILDCLRSIQVDCEGTGLTLTLPKVKRLLQQIHTSQISFRELDNACREIFERFTDELDSRLFLAIHAQHVPYYNDFVATWAMVIDQFPSVSKDIEEASKCFALNRYTGCVFHLMRVAEAGLAAIAKRVGLVNAKPGWEEAITYIEGQLNKNYQEMDAIFKGDAEFLRSIAAHMRDVNVAWRRRVSHIERNYSEEESQRIFAATKGLMEQLATKLSEVGAS